jgi:hypothetical protein
MSNRKTAEAVNLDADPITDTAYDVGEFPPRESSATAVADASEGGKRIFKPVRSWDERYDLGCVTKC